MLLERDYYALAVMLAVAFIMCLLVGCQVPLRTLVPS
jgi:hypothetical protein